MSVDANGRRGAWGDTQALILRPTPRAPLGRVSPDGSAIELSWGGNPDDRAEVELARDAAFQQIVARGDFGAPGGKLAPSARRHLLRALPLRRAGRLQDGVERRARRSTSRATGTRPGALCCRTR